MIHRKFAAATPRMVNALRLTWTARLRAFTINLILFVRAVRLSGRIGVMFRTIAIIAAGIALASCASDSGSSSNLFAFEPAKDTINFESQPPGAEAKTSTGQTCRTPCSLAIPADKGFSVTFTLVGYQPATEEVQLVSMGDGTSKLRPDPVLVELAPAAPPPKAKKKVRAKKMVAKPPTPAPAVPARAAPPAPPPAAPAQQPQTTSPWPNTPPAQSR
jgi:hypothetical protein